MHLAAKQLSAHTDAFAYGIEPLVLLLFYGSVVAARSGFAKVLDVHKRILTRVRQGAATANGCAHTTAVCELTALC